MELLSYQDYSNTLLGYHMYFRSQVLNEDICEECKSIQKYYYQRYKISRTPETFYSNNCICEKRGKTYFVAIQIKARGNPIPTNPAQTIYEVCIWNLERPYRVECTAELLMTEKPKFQFMIDYAEQVKDLDFTNQGIIIQFYKYLTDLTESNFSFKGLVSRKSYLQDFLERIEKIKNGVPRPIQQDTENCHLVKRNKGHSHVR